MNNSNNNDNNKQNYNNNIQSQPLNQKQIKKQEEAEAAQDVAHTVGKGAATYYGGAVGNQLYDIASKTKLGKSIERNAGKMAMKNPLLKPAMKNLHKSGATKVANNIIDNLGSKKGSTTAMNKGAKSTNKDLGLASKNKMTLPSRNTQRVTPNFSEQQPDFDNMTEEQIEEYQNQQEELKRQQINQENQEKRKAKAKKIGEAIIRNPHLAMLVVGIGVIIIFVVIIMYMIVSDMDLVGTKMTSYSQAESISGYCDHITLVKEHDSFTGEPVASIDDVNLDETFKLNNTTVKRYSIKTYDVESYVKGVVQAEAEAVNDAKTFEVAAIAARTYALQITNKQCLTWDNTNKRPQYRNPQNFTDSSPSELVASGVTGTQGLVVTIEGKLLDMSQNNYYDYFCNIGKTREDEENVFYQMLQKNKEERLLIPIKWAKENNAEGLTYSGKYDGSCQENGMSLFGAKYLLNKKADAYTTIRVIKYYYGYHVELKKLDTYVANGCFYWPTDGTTITSRFGLRNAPTEGASTNHGAIDIGVPEGTNVYATSSGKVTVAGAVSGYGYAVYIDHGNGIVSRYGHLKAGGIKVSVGQQVTAGQVIALSGNTGISTGPHLHFEVRVNDVKVDPLNYVSPSNPTPTSCGLSTSIKSSFSGKGSKEFINYIAPYAVQDMHSSNILASITIAQAALESGWGSSGLSTNYNNYFGIKAGSSWTGSTVNLNTKEESNGVKYTTSASWRVYQSPLESIKDHSRLLQTERYKAVVGEKDYKTAITIIKNAGYATDSEYIDKIVAIIEANELYKYDNM